MSEVFLGINKAGQLYVDATLDASITLSIMLVYFILFLLIYTRHSMAMIAINYYSCHASIPFA